MLLRISIFLLALLAASACVFSPSIAKAHDYSMSQAPRLQAGELAQVQPMLDAYARDRVGLDESRFGSFEYCWSRHAKHHAYERDPEFVDTLLTSPQAAGDLSGDQIDLFTVNKSAVKDLTRWALTYRGPERRLLWSNSEHTKVIIQIFDLRISALMASDFPPSVAQALTRTNWRSGIEISPDGTMNYEYGFTVVVGFGHQGTPAIVTTYAGGFASPTSAGRYPAAHAVREYYPNYRPPRAP